MNLKHYSLLLFVFIVFQVMIMGQAHEKSSSDNPYAFIVAGHAYGSHSGTNLGLHPPLLDRLDAGYDPAVKFIVFTGDIVRTSTEESWQQVENELSGYPFDAYYCLGNHDDNDAGMRVFNEKFGGLYYAFMYASDMFIVLNSIETDRSISTEQLDFMTNQLNNYWSIEMNVFIFFHEVIWNSLDKYRDVRSNSRSRYDQMVEHSNFWEEVFPILVRHPEKNFYLFAGDVGGNEDAIAAFYDRWNNVTLLASGMGEVADENYLLIKVLSSDSVELNLAPLDPELSLPAVEHFSIPPAPDSIQGPFNVRQGSTEIVYTVSEIPLATDYNWELPAGMEGASNTQTVVVDVANDFLSGDISVKVERDGFGTGLAASKSVSGYGPPVAVQDMVSDPQVILRSYPHYLIIEAESIHGSHADVRIIDMSGRILKSVHTETISRKMVLEIDTTDLPEGLLMIQVISDNMVKSIKFVNKY